MTSTIKVASHNYPVSVQTFDRVWDAERGVLTEDYRMAADIVLKPEDGEQHFHSSTTRKLVITDLEYDDERATKPR